MTEDISDFKGQFKQEIIKQTLDTFFAFQNIAQEHLNGFRMTTSCKWKDIDNDQQECIHCGDVCNKPTDFADIMSRSMSNCFCGEPIACDFATGKKLPPWTKDQYKEHQRYQAYLSIQSGYERLERLGEFRTELS